MKMKSLGQQHSLLHYCSLATLFLYYLISISSTVSLVSSQCVDILNPLDPFDSKSRTFSACPPVNEANTNSLLLNNDNNSVSSTNDSMIKILFTCGANDDPKMCEKAKSAFEEAANFITNTINLQVPITLNASFFNICGVMITCPPGKPPFIGAASTSRYIPFLDDDNVVRLYPQALAKQFKFERHPEYLPLDIVSGFNSAVNVFWFKGDPPIRDDQVDFRLVVTHEIMHGLGLLSSWADYFSSDAATGLTTFPSFLFKETFENVTGEITFTGFQENCFDRRLQFASNNQSLDNIMTQLNKFAGGVENKTKFSGFDDFRSQFVNSSIFQTYAVDMLKQATTNDSILFRAHDDDGSNSDPIFIETSIVPYRAGSSMTHLDSITNNHTLDFLMMWRVPRGATAENLTSINGGNTSYTNPIGPKTIKILETLGYQTANYKNPYRPKDIVISNTT